MASQRTQTYVLVGLAVVLAGSLYYSIRGADTASEVPVDNFTFKPLDVQEPRLHIDRLNRLLKLEYSGSHRNIFVAAAPPPTQAAGEKALKPPEPFVGPKPPPPPPPLQVPAEFFGYATRSASGRRVAFFTSGEDVLVVAEGDTFLGRYRLVRIGNDTAEVEELGTGRHATVPMVQVPAEQSGAQ
jgi:hypothetical protein